MLSPHSCVRQFEADPVLWQCLCSSLLLSVGPFPAFYILFRDERNYSTENGLRATGLVGVVSVVRRDMFRERRSRDSLSRDAQWRVACGV